MLQDGARFGVVRDMRRTKAICLVCGLFLLIWAAPGNATTCYAGETNSMQLTREQAEQAARQYLALPRDKRADLEKLLGGYSGPIDPVIESLKPAPGKAEVRKGEIKKEHFTVPGLAGRYPEDLLYFYVPDNYDPAKPIGLFIFMHGGDGGTPREMAGVIVSSPDEDPKSRGLRPQIEKASFITVAPSAPTPGSGQRWNMPEVDEYIISVIDECAHRFNIDRDRIFLGGHSMGGYGAYHLCQRLNDRLAGALLSAGAWKISDFRTLAGTGAYIIHGRNDTAPGAAPIKSQGTRRAEWTGVAFARAADELMKRDGVEHIYHEHAGGHSFRDGKEGLVDFIKWTDARKRNPYPARVWAVSPRGSWLAGNATKTPDSYWIGIREVGSDKIEYDAITLTGPNVAKTAEDFEKQGYTLGKTDLRGGRIEAEMSGDNVIRVKTENVKGFSIWLHPKMVDFARPVTVVLNGARQEHVVRPSLLDALRSYERKKDWGLIYHAEIRLV